MRKLIMSFNNKIVSLFVASIFIIFILFGLSVAGNTFAWFTSATATIDNTFIAGTIEIEVSDPVYPGSVNGTQSPVFLPGECTEISYTINQTGTKSNYIRASFDGYWRKTYQRNVASVTASYNGQTITDTDSAYYSYGSHNFVDFNPPVYDIAEFGFSDSVYKTPLQFVPLPETYTETSNGSGNGGTGNGGLDDFSYPENCTGPKGYLVKPAPTEQGGNEPLIESLSWPPDCSIGQRKVLKLPKVDGSGQPILGPNNNILDFDDGSVSDGDVYEYIHDDGFHIKLIVKEINGVKYFAFKTNYPVYHVYVKGGEVPGNHGGGNLYSYYFNSEPIPTGATQYPDGVTTDCNLSQKSEFHNSGGWSHIAIYYCAEGPEPGIKLQKQVSVKNDTNGNPVWEDADSAPGPVVSSETPPIFRFIITNTGNVPLTNIEVRDEYLDYTYPLSSLGIGGQHTTTNIAVDSDWQANQSLSTGNVTVKVVSANWTPAEHTLDKDNYFYYRNKIDSNHPNPFIVQFRICLADDTEGQYDGAIFTLYTHFEAIQASNNMPDHNNWDIIPLSP